jgi:hypothetical protein
MANGATWAAANPEKVKAYSRRYREKNRAKLRADAAAFRSANPEKVKEHHRKHYENNKEKIEGYSRKYCEDNKERIKEYGLKYYEANGESLRFKACVVRQQSRRALLQKLGDKCALCGFSDWRALQIDHVNNNGYQHRRKYNCGSNAYYNNILENIDSGEYQLLCANCNWIKRYESMRRKRR